MKKIILSVAFFGACVLFNQVQAQPGFQVHVNLGVQPSWIPSGYAGEDYYYLPDIEAYYCVPQRQFVYQEGNRWISAAYLPDRYRGYDLYRGNKIAINEARPYLRNDFYRDRYSRYGSYHNRIPDRRIESRYGNRGFNERHDDHRFDDHRNNFRGDRRYDHNQGRRY